jgi:hypothetical protein
VSHQPRFASRMKWLAALLIAFSTSALGAEFANQFVQFKLPPNWKCTLEGAEWVCQGQDPNRKRDAIIILAAKLKGDQDSLDQYLDYLKKPKNFRSIQKKPVRSEPKYSKTVSLNAHAWVDSLHLESEIPGFYTRYLATIKKDIAVLVTYSINKEKYSTYLSDFEQMVKSLRVFRKSGPINAAAKEGNLFAQGSIPTSVGQGSVFQAVPQTQQNPNVGQQIKKQDDSMFLFGALGLAVVAFIIWRRRQG